MKLPSDEIPPNMNGEGFMSDEFDQLEMMPAPIRDGDFSEYMWMENEEEFNSQVGYAMISKIPLSVMQTNYLQFSRY